MGQKAGYHLLGLGFAERPFIDQAPSVDLARRRVAGDGAIHDRLRERRLVRLVVTMPPITEHVDDDILLEAVTELGGESRDMHDRLGIVAVHMKNRRLDNFCDIGGIGTRSRIGRRRGEADLVVDDDMDGAAGTEALELGELQRFGDQPLAYKGGIAMHQHADDLIALDVSALPLLRPNLAEHDRVDCLEMGGVCLQRHMDGVAIELAVVRGAEMVFDVARALDFLRVRRVALEFGEDRGERLAEEIRKDIEPAAVRHPDDELLHAELAATLDDLFERRDKRFGALDPEPLRARIALVQKALEGFRHSQALEDGALALGGEVGLVAGSFDSFLDPRLLGRVLDVHVFDADMVAIGLA